MMGLWGNSFLKYSSERGIKQVDFHGENLYRESIDKNNIISHMYTLKEFHQKAMGYNNYIGHRLEDKRGRTVEQYKIYLKKVRRIYESFKEKPDLNDFEKIILQYGEGYLDRAESCVETIYENKYLDLIKRSMDRNEICLGDTYFTNIRENKYIEVNNLNKCIYDLLEMDGVDFLNKLMKKGFQLDYKELIESFCKIEDLGIESQRFIEALISYPYDFMKTCVKYNKKSSKEDKEKYEAKLRKIVEVDSLILI